MFYRKLCFSDLQVVRTEVGVQEALIRDLQVVHLELEERIQEVHPPAVVPIVGHLKLQELTQEVLPQLALILGRLPSLEQAEIHQESILQVLKKKNVYCN